MGLIKSAAKLGLGLATGGAIGAAVASLTAPDDPTSKRYRIRQHFRDARQAGNDAKRVKQDELKNRYRRDVGDWEAFEDVVEHKSSAADAVTALGLGLNAPGAIAAQIAADRDE